MSFFSRVTWQNRPSTATPLNATNLNSLEARTEAAVDTLTASGPGAELAYAEATADALSQTNTSYEDIDNLSSIEFTVGDRPVRVELFIPLVQVSAAGSVFTTKVCEAADEASILASTDYYPGAAFAEQPLLIARRISTPGTYTLKAMAKISTGSYGLKPDTYDTPIYLTAVAL